MSQIIYNKWKLMDSDIEQVRHLLLKLQSN